jgi:hypothetical protein
MSPSTNNWTSRRTEHRCYAEIATDITTRNAERNDITHIVLYLCFDFLRLVMLPVSLNCPFLIAPSIFFNVYISTSHQTNIFKEYSSFPIHVLTKCIKKICHNYVTLAHVIVNTNIASYNIYYYK